MCPCILCIPHANHTTGFWTICLNHHTLRISRQVPTLLDLPLAALQANGFQGETAIQICRDFRGKVFSEAHTIGLANANTSSLRLLDRHFRSCKPGQKLLLKCDMATQPGQQSSGCPLGSVTATALDAAESGQPWSALQTLHLKSVSDLCTS